MSSSILMRPAVLAWVAGLFPLPLFGWTPGSYPAGSSGFTVDSQSRNDVVSFWHGVYQASEGYWNRCAWTGNYTAASPYDSGVGTTAAVFVTDTERRINFHRAMCGVPANVTLNTTATVLIESSDAHQPATSTLKRDAVQRAAYMLIRTWGYFDGDDGSLHPPLGNSWAALGHNPVQASCVAWTTAAWNANSRSNLAIGYYGPGAMDAYIAEEAGTGASTSEWNTDVGHRRWLLYPASTNMATGDTPGQFTASSNEIRLPTNTLYVVPKASEKATVAADFTSYPPAGYVPASLNSGYWSLTYPGASFTDATVTMTTAGGSPVNAQVVKRNGAFGDPALVWQVDPAASVKSVSTDTTFNVSVSGITGTGVPSSHSYAVTLINPNQITSDQSIFGPATPSLTAGATYQITVPDGAEAVQLNLFQASSTAWTEGAEDSPAPQVVASTGGTYAYRSTCNFTSYPPPYFVSITGGKSFRLTFPCYYDPRLNGIPEQSFMLDRKIVPNTSAQLSFKYRRGLMSTTTFLYVERSDDDGVTWTTLGSPIAGGGQGVIDSAPTSATRTMTTGSSPCLIRFRLSHTPSSDGFLADQAYGGVDWTTYPTGIFIDDITTTNCQWLDLKKTNDLAAGATSLALSSTTAGVTPTNGLELRLRMRTKLGNRWMPYGPPKTVTYTTAAQTATPVFSPASGTYAAGQAVTITSAGATIYYRVDGGTEQSAASPVALSVPAYPGTLSVIAYARKSAEAGSALASASYLAGEPAATPVISPAAGEYPAGQAITITGETGSTIHYQLNGAAEQTAATPVTGLSVPAYPATLTVTAHAEKTGKVTSATASATYSSTPFKSWAGTYFPGVSDPATIGAAADPDGDGKTNLLEFALGGDPGDAGDSGVIRPLTNDGTGVAKLLLTIPVRSGAAAFTGSPSPSATVDGITYTILGGLTPSQTDSAVWVVSPAVTTGLPAAPAGYEYRTFKLNASAGLPSKGFMRVKVNGSL